MNTNTPQWARDIQSVIDAVPYGQVNLSVKRVDKKTVEVSSTGKETLRYVSNDDALRDISNLTERLIQARFSGSAHVELEMKDGQIRFIGVFSKKSTTY